MIDLQNEKIVTLRQAAKYLPLQSNGKKIHLSTLYRWSSRGVQGIRLETLKLGARVVTSVEALQRFAERCSSGTEVCVPAKLRARQLSIERAEQELSDEGI